jgi:hypothetical protein
VIAYDFGYIGLAGNDIIGLSGPWEAMRVLGTVAVEKDGSATFRVPANTPIAFQALDAEGKAVQLMRFCCGRLVCVFARRGRCLRFAAERSYAPV